MVGYGDLVGAPLSIMLAQDSIRGNATVTICHVKTRDLAAHTRRADILVAAAGVPQLITGDMVKPGATVVDVGVHRTDRRARRRRAVRRGRRGRGRDHAGARRGRSDDDRDAAGEHRDGRRGPGARDVSPTGRPAGRAPATGGFAVTGEVVPPRCGDGRRSRRHARALVGYVDAANVTDNPIASAHMSPLAGARFVARSGRRADPAAHVPRPEPAGDHGRPAGRHGRSARATCSVLTGDPLDVGDHPDATVGERPRC